MVIYRTTSEVTQLWLSKFHIFFKLISKWLFTASSVKGGNAQIPKALIKESKANVLMNSAVTEITRKQNGGYGVTYDKLSPKSLSCDVVILAAPLEWTGNLKFNRTIRNIPDSCSQTS